MLLTTSAPVSQCPKSVYAELYSGDRSSACAHRPQSELGSGAITKVSAEVSLRRTPDSCILTDQNGEPVAPQSTREDDEQEARGEHEGEEDDGWERSNDVKKATGVQ